MFYMFQSNKKSCSLAVLICRSTRGFSFARLKITAGLEEALVGDSQPNVNKRHISLVSIFTQSRESGDFRGQNGFG